MRTPPPTTTTSSPTLHSWGLFALMFRLFVFLASLPLCFAFLLSELVIFLHSESWPSVCRFMCVCVCERACVFTKNAIESKSESGVGVQILSRRDGCFENTGFMAGQLFSVQGTNTEDASWISDGRFLSWPPGGEIWTPRAYWFRSFPISKGPPSLSSAARCRAGATSVRQQRHYVSPSALRTPRAPGWLPSV